MYGSDLRAEVQTAAEERTPVAEATGETGTHLPLVGIVVVDLAVDGRLIEP